MTKVCTSCKKEKSTDDFVRHRKSKDGFSSWCKKCHCDKSKEYREKNLEKVKAAAKRWQDANPINHRRAHLRKVYGIELEDYEVLLANQDGGCAICGRVEADAVKNYLCVDHVAGTLKIRGLLCSFCNSAIGLLDHDPERLTRAIEYLAQEPAMEGRLYPQGVHRACSATRWLMETFSLDFRSGPGILSGIAGIFVAIRLSGEGAPHAPRMGHPPT